MPFKDPVELSRRILQYLASAEGLWAIFEKAANEPDESPITLDLPDGSSTEPVTVPAGLIWRLAEIELGLSSPTTPVEIHDVLRNIPLTCKFCRRLVEDRPEFRTRAAYFRILDIQKAADEFYKAKLDERPYDPVTKFSNLKPLCRGFVMEFETPSEYAKAGIGCVAVVFIARLAMPKAISGPPHSGTDATGSSRSTGSQRHRTRSGWVRRFWNRLLRGTSQGTKKCPKWDMLATIIYEGRGAILAREDRIRFLVADDGTLVPIEDGEYFAPDGMYVETTADDLRGWEGVRDMFLAPCLTALNSINSETGH